MSQTVAIVLNWRDAASTLACVESLTAIDQSLDIIVVDNASGDGSLESIAQHCRGLADRAGYRMVDPSAIAGLPQGERFISVFSSGRNGGYAFGNNVGIRHALQVPDCRYVWILNNDTLVPNAQSLTSLVAKMDRNPDIGICGATVVYAEDREKVQTLGGGVMDRKRCRGAQLGQGHRLDQPVDEGDIEARLSYINGACSFVRREFIEKVGLMTEDYFLYYEEVDWSMKGEALFRLGYCASSIVYHFVGKAIGTSDTQQRSQMSTYYLTSSRIKFCGRHLRHALLFTIGDCFVEALRNVRHRRWGQARAIMCAVFGIDFHVAKKWKLLA